MNRDVFIIDETSIKALRDYLTKKPYIEVWPYVRLLDELQKVNLTFESPPELLDAVPEEPSDK